MTSLPISSAIQHLQSPELTAEHGRSHQISNQQWQIRNRNQNQAVRGRSAVARAMNEQASRAGGGIMGGGGAGAGGGAIGGAAGGRPAEENGERNEGSTAQKPKNKGPAAWRRLDGPVLGLARRKGETNPNKWGFQIKDEYLGHPALQKSEPLPARPPKKEGEGRKCVIQ